MKSTKLQYIIFFILFFKKIINIQFGYTTKSYLAHITVHTAIKTSLKITNCISNNNEFRLYKKSRYRTYFISSQKITYIHLLKIYIKKSITTSHIKS